LAVKKILFLTINFPPNPSVGTHRVSKILKYLDHSRFTVYVLTLKEKYYDLEFGGGASGDAQKIPSAVHIVRSDRWDLTYIFTKAKAVLRTINPKKGIKRTAMQTSGIPRAASSAASSKKSKFKTLIYGMRDFVFAVFEFPDKYIGWMPHAVRQGVRLVKEHNIDAVFTTAPPHSLFLMAVLIKKFTGVKLILDFRDPWALSRWDKGSRLKYILEKRLEKSAVKAADLLLFVTSNLQEEYAINYAWTGKNKFKLFSNGFDPDDFKHISAKKSNRNSDRIRFVHLGTLYKKRNPSTLLQAIAELIAEKKVDPAAFRIDFIGFVAKELRGIHNEIQKLNLGNVIRFFPPVSFAESIQTMYNADVLLLIQPGTDLQIPAKLFEYMYTQKPIFAVAEPDSATERAIRGGRLGIFAPSQEVPEIKKAFLEIFRFIENEGRPDETYISKFDYSAYIKKLEHYLESV